jgi:hypothetical protein
MTHAGSRHLPIEFSGSVEALATTLGLPVLEIRAAIGGLIRAGHLERVTGSSWRLRPPRCYGADLVGVTIACAPAIGLEVSLFQSPWSTAKSANTPTTATAKAINSGQTDLVPCSVCIGVTFRVLASKRRWSR